jgi:hypothetical protein
MKRLRLVALAAVIAAGTFGCQGAPSTYVRPGPVEYQQARAQRFDPYPENDTGPPIVGGRPREFENPPPEVQRARPDVIRNRWLPWNWGQATANQ